MKFRLDVATKRGVVLNGVLFRPEEERKADTVMIAITGIHGNFCSNPFYYNIGDTLNAGGIDLIYVLSFLRCHLENFHWERHMQCGPALEF